MTKKLHSNEKILTVTGEHSGDLLGADLIKNMKLTKPDLQFIGVGGKEMSAEGLYAIDQIENTNASGLKAAVLKYPYLKRLARRLIKICIQEKIRFAVLIDFPGFNLRLAEMLKKHNICVIYYVSPQIWAWNFKRIHKIRKYTDLMLTLFEFEKKIYDSYSVKCVCTGHPVKKRVLSQSSSLTSLIDKSFRFTVSLLPGSRKTKIRLMLPLLFEIALNIQKKFPSDRLRFLIPNINSKEEKYIQEQIRKIREIENINIVYVYNNSLSTMNASDLIILGSGTAVLEASVLEKPMITVTKIHPFSYFLAKRLIKIPYISLVNIISGREVCKEFIQQKCIPENIAVEAERILTDKTYRDQKVEDLKKVNLSLGNEDPSKKASYEIFNFINSVSLPVSVFFAVIISNFFYI